jgi:DNA polymerase alpha subunit B
MSNVFSGGKPNTQQQQPRQRVAPLSASLQSNTTGDTQMSQTSSQFINRKATHVLDGQYNGNLPLSLNQDEDMQDIDQELTFTQSQIKPYRYMHEKIREKGEGLDDRIDYIGGLIGQAYHIAAFGNPSYPSQESVYAYGMICSDSSAEGSKLNDKSVVLETSRDLGMGKHVPLDLSKVDSYSLFPGQIVGMKGTNHNGRAFQVEEILLVSSCIFSDSSEYNTNFLYNETQPPMPEKHTLPPKENKTINMIVATGPYTLDDDLSFRPFKELLDMCQEQKPDVILLLGPFLSIHHPKVASANMDSLPEHILREQVVANIETLLDTSCTQTHVFLAPHVNDLTHHYSNLFPQPKFGTAMSSKHNRIHLSSNPASIEMNGHTIKMANMDILFRLGKEEISKSPKQADKFTRLVEHVLQQHTYVIGFLKAE